MGKFNKGSVKTRKYTKNTVQNRAGGYVYDISVQSKLAGIVFTSLVKDEFYRSQDKLISELKELIAKNDPLFVAKTCWKARHVYGLRSISHLVAATLAETGGTSGVSWGSKFYESIIVRPDDITEILSLLDGKPSHAMRKGFAKAMQSFDEYQLAKYAKFQKADGSINLNDVMRICHVPFQKAKRDKNNNVIGEMDPLEKLMYRTLRNTDTLESKNNSTEGLINLLTRNKLGYTALIKNLKNIIQKENEELTTLACKALINERAVLNENILPFQFLIAYEKLKSTFSNDTSRKVIEHLVKACDISMKNIPELKGKTLILIEQSGSMKDIKNTAHLFACALAHACENYVVAAFSDYQYDYSSYRSRNASRGSTMNYIDTLTENNILNTAMNLSFRGGGTNFCSTYDKLAEDKIKVDRVIQITDDQQWGRSSITGIPSYLSFREWCKKVKMDPEVWSIDIAGLGTSSFPVDKVRIMYGISAKIFDIMHELEKDSKAFINSINDVQLLTKKEYKNSKRVSFEIET